MKVILTGSHYNEPIKTGLIDLDPRNRKSIDRDPIDLEPNKVGPIKIEPIKVGPIDIEPIDAEPITLDPLDREPTLFIPSTRSVTCSKPIFSNYFAIMNLILTGSDYNEPIYHRLRAYRCSAYHTRPSRLRAYIIHSLHPECYLFKTDFQHLLCNNESNIDLE